MRAHLVAFALFLASCKPDAPAPGPGLTWVTASSDALQWSGPGWVQLVAPVRAPTSVDRTAHILVALWLPPGKGLGSTFPEGARAVRVEFAGSTDADDVPDAAWAVRDVRSFEWGERGVTCGVLRPAEGGLAGLTWHCGVVGDEAAGTALAELVRTKRLHAPEELGRREAAAAALAGLNGCVGCHQPARDEDRRVCALVQRGTDAHGLFSLRSLFRDEDPVERYRPVNANAADPLLTPVCPQSTIDFEAARCADGLRPLLRLDVARGVAMGDRHVRQLCDARLKIAARLDPRAREAVKAALEVCEPP